MKLSTLLRQAHLPLLALAGFAAPAAAQCLEWNPSFASGALTGAPFAEVRASVEFDDGSGPALFVAGEILTAGALTVNHVAKWDGRKWSALGSGMNDPVYALAVFDDGNGPALYAGGIFTTAGGIVVNGVARWDGTSWSALGLGVGGSSGAFVHALCAFDDGTGSALYAGGEFMTAGGLPASRIARWNGAAWSALDLGHLDGRVTRLEVYTDPSGPGLYLAGSFMHVGALTATRFARFGAAGWTAPPGPGSQADDLEVYDPGTGPKLFATGNFHTAGGVTTTRIASFDGVAWSPLGTGLNNIGHSLGVHDDGTGPALYAGGQFTSAGGVSAQHVARWNGTSWSALGSGIDGIPLAFTSFEHGGTRRLAVGGDFLEAGGLATQGLAIWDQGSWSATGGGLDGFVMASIAHDDGQGPSMFVAGQFTGGIARWDGYYWRSLDGIQGTANAELASFDDGSGPALYASGVAVRGPASSLVRWNGTSWSLVGGPVSGTVHSLCAHDDGSGPALYVGGLTQAGGQPVQNIARWNGSQWSAVGSGIVGNTALAMASYDDGNGPILYAGYGASTAGGAPYDWFIQWDGTSWSQVVPAPNSNPNALLVHDDGTGPKLYMTGSFTQIGGVPMSRIACFDGVSWQPLGGGLDAAGTSLASYDDGTGSALYVGGNFGSAGGVSVLGIARWDGTSWSALHDAPVVGVAGGMVRTLAAYPGSATQPSGLFVGGQFTTAGTKPSLRVAEWQGCPGPGTLFCFGDGTSAACPCGNDGASGRGCANSGVTSPAGAQLRASGTAQPDSVTLHVTGELPTAASIFLQGTAVIAPSPFGDGLRCVGGSLKRLYVVNAVSGDASAPPVGASSITLRSAELGDPIAPGSSRFYQTYYRDPDLAFCAAPTGNTWNVSNAVAITW